MLRERASAERRDSERALQLEKKDPMKSRKPGMCDSGSHRFGWRESWAGPMSRVSCEWVC